MNIVLDTLDIKTVSVHQVEIIRQQKNNGKEIQASATSKNKTKS